ncbi:MAG TPA: hypothetical protein VE081_07450 [Sporichthyaceae bacterium]|nr:hypothetical protein [Sporichthyaceae bacterium]
MGTLLLRVLLAVLGVLLRVGRRLSPRMRAQITTDLVIEIRSGDGVAHHYVFSGKDRSIASRAGRAPGPTDLSLSFKTALLGFTTLIRTDAVGAIVRLALADRVRYSGNAAYALWFWGLTRMVLPLGRQRPGRAPLPGALLAPDPASKVAGRITREPVATELDPAWTAAHSARAEMAMLQGVNGVQVAPW